MISQVERVPLLAQATYRMFERVGLYLALPFRLMIHVLKQIFSIGL
jgi:hypothetical protein